MLRFTKNVVKLIKNTFLFFWFSLLTLEYPLKVPSFPNYKILTLCFQLMTP